MNGKIPDTDRRRDLLAQLAAILEVDSGGNGGVIDQGNVAVAVQSPATELRKMGLPVADSRPSSVLAELPSTAANRRAAGPRRREGEFLPVAPSEFSKLRLAETELVSLLLKFLLHRQSTAGSEIAQQVGVSFGICEKLLSAMKADRLVILKAAASLGDYIYELTESGVHQAQKFSEQCSYFGAAPVCLEDYAASVAAQSLQNSQPQIDDLRRAFSDLSLDDETFERLGRAIISGKGLFLHGPPGNGKTSIAKRVTRAYGESIWIPRVISAWGEIIRVFDPSCREELPLPKGQGVIDDDRIDHRWVRIRRPTIVVGGELVLDNLEITPNPATGIAESPLQLKSNCGTLVIDDFGRQQVAPAALLNRWIVPLEKRYDFLNLISGRKIRVPFDQFVVFSTNLEPRELVDEAFLRRIPYKIDVGGPSEEQFRVLFLQVAASMGIAPSQPSLDHLVDEYYRKTGRPMRFCHARDLLRQVQVYYEFIEQPVRLSVEALDSAATDYFSVL